MKVIVTGVLIVPLLALSVYDYSVASSVTQAGNTLSTSQSNAQTESPVVLSKVVDAQPGQSTMLSGLDWADMNLAVRAQDNFYQYVNGGWLDAHHIGEDKTVIGSFYDLRDRAVHDVKAIIDDLSHSNNLQVGTIEQQIFDLFRSFMDTETIEASGIEPIRDVLNAIDAMGKTSGN